MNSMCTGDTKWQAQNAQGSFERGDTLENWGKTLIWENLAAKHRINFNNLVVLSFSHIGLFSVFNYIWIIYVITWLIPAHNATSNSSASVLYTFVPEWLINNSYSINIIEMDQSINKQVTLATQETPKFENFHLSVIFPVSFKSCGYYLSLRMSEWVSV
jgi:hypothetical protein